MEDQQPHLENRANPLTVAAIGSTPSEAGLAFGPAGRPTRDPLIRNFGDRHGYAANATKIEVAPVRTVVIKEIARKALIRRARERLNAIEEMRDAKQLSLAGKSQREIAEVLSTTQSRVHRILRGAKTLGKSATPEELILRAFVDGTARELLVEDLSTMHYTFATYAPSACEGSIPGTWTQVGAAHVLGLLSDEEYGEICAAVRPPIP